jgi:hypothetical protein
MENGEKSRNQYRITPFLMRYSRSFSTTTGAFCAARLEIICLMNFFILPLHYPDFQIPLNKYNEITRARLGIYAHYFVQNANCFFTGAAHNNIMLLARRGGGTGRRRGLKILRE